MIRNYFKIAFRNLTRHKFISFINLFGLTIGLTCCLFITSFILDELSYDRYNVNRIICTGSLALLGIRMVPFSSIAFVTVSFQAIKAAIANPVKSLRSE